MPDACGSRPGPSTKAPTWDSTAAPRHSIEGAFSWKSTHTPLFDSLVQYQLGDGDVYTYFLALIGRLFYRVKRFDNFSIVPMIKGDTGTGKSTVLTIIKRLFAPAAVGVLNSNNEVTFGLEAKQGLLDLRSETARLRLVTRLFRAAIKRLDFVERAQARARSNGKVRFPT